MITTLQSLRFIFVMMVFMSHFAYHDVKAFDAGGDCGVAFFFLLSGFVIALNYGSKIKNGSFSYSIFLRRRLMKIFPLHLLLLVVIMIISHLSFGIPVLLNALLLQSWMPIQDYYFSCNSVSWFLSSLLFCYAIFPWLYKHSSWRFLAFVIIAYVVVYILVPYENVNDILYVNPLVRSVDFYLGVVLCQFYEKRKREGHSCESLLEVICVIMLVFALSMYPVIDSKFRNAPLFWMVLIPFIYVFSFEKGIVSALLDKRFMRFLGSLTMPFFLIHQMVINVLTHRFESLSYGYMLLLCFLVTLLASVFLQQVVLRPVQNMK